MAHCVVTADNGGCRPVVAAQHERRRNMATTKPKAEKAKPTAKELDAQVARATAEMKKHAKASPSKPGIENSTSVASPRV
jgi:16S rRNA G527 N7-methylase RsmG